MSWWPRLKQKPVIDLHKAQWTAYREYCRDARCAGCGAKLSEKAIGALWRTEEWCGCELEKLKPDMRPDWEDFA